MPGARRHAEAEGIPCEYSVRPPYADTFQPGDGRGRSLPDLRHLSGQYRYMGTDSQGMPVWECQSGCSIKHIERAEHRTHRGAIWGIYKKKNNKDWKEELELCGGTAEPGGRADFASVQLGAVVELTPLGVRDKKVRVEALVERKEYADPRRARPPGVEAMPDGRVTVRFIGPAHPNQHIRLPENRRQHFEYIADWEAAGPKHTNRLPLPHEVEWSFLARSRQHKSVKLGSVVNIPRGHCAKQGFCVESINNLVTDIAHVWAVIKDDPVGFVTLKDRNINIFVCIWSMVLWMACRSLYVSGSYVHTLLAILGCTLIVTVIMEVKTVPFVCRWCLAQ